MPTYRTLASLLTLLTDNNAGLITAFTDQDFAVSVGDMAAGTQSIRQQYGVTGTNSTADWTALSNALNSSSRALWPQANIQLNSSGKTLTQELYWDGLFLTGPFMGAAAQPTFNPNSLGSGAVIFSPNESVYFRDMSFTNGKVILDLGSTTVEIPIIHLEGLYCGSISCILRDGSIANGLTRKLDKLIFRKNYLRNNDRGLFVNGNGASRAWVQNNHVENPTRFGLLVAPATPSPQQNGFGDFMFYTNNLVEGLTYSGANSNPVYMAGRYGVVSGNIVANSVQTADPNQSNFEPYYFKTIGCAIFGNLSIDGGNQQGIYALKGTARTNSDNSPGGADYVLCGNIGIVSQGTSNIAPSVWIQCVDANIGNNIFDGTSQSAHVNKQATDTPANNILFHDNLYTQVQHGSGLFIAEGSGKNIECVGNSISGAGGSGQGFAVRFDSQNLGNMENYRCEQNTAYGLNVSAAGRFDFIHLKPQGTDRLLGCTVYNNVVDLLNCPDQTNVYGVTFDDTGDVVDVVIDHNQFRNFSNPAHVIRNVTSGGTRAGQTVTILDNVGFANDNSGTATITVGNASVTINHGMPQTPGMVPTPAATDISVVPTTFLFGATQARVTNLTATTFDVVLDAAVATSDWTFSWRCRKTKWAFA